MEQFTNNRIVQIDFDGAVKATLSGMSKRLILTATQPCYVRFNQDNVSDSTGMLIPSNTPVTVDLTLVASAIAIKSGSAGKLTIMELF